MRFGDALRLEKRKDVEARLDRHLVPPIPLQLLLENAVKHNELTRAEPLRVCRGASKIARMLKNAKRLRRDPPVSAGIGLSANSVERCRLTTGRDVDVDGRRGRLPAVRLPLLSA